MQLAGIFFELQCCLAIVLDMNGDYVASEMERKSKSTLRPELVIVDSPYRHVLGPILDYIRETRRQLPDRDIAVIIPELVESRWWHHVLHN